MDLITLSISLVTTVFYYDYNLYLLAANLKGEIIIISKKQKYHRGINTSVFTLMSFDNCDRCITEGIINFDRKIIQEF